MNSKIFAVIMVVIFGGAIFYFASRPMGKSVPKESEEHHQNPDTEKPTSSLAEESYQYFLNQKKENNFSIKELDDQLDALSAQFPTDYRFPLERVRGASTIKGIHNHAEEFELLTDAALKAIECNCGASKKMLQDLLAHQKDKLNGFWKLVTHPKQWNPIINALEKEEEQLLEVTNQHHH